MPSAHISPTWFRWSLATLGAVCLMTSPASGAIYKWDFDGNALIGTPPNATPGSGTWDTTATLWNVTGNTDVAWVNGNTAQFGSTSATDTGPFTITVDSTVTSLSGLTFNSSGFTLSASATRSIAVNGAIEVGSGVTATIGNRINLTNVSGFGFGSGRLTLASGSSIASNGTADFAISNMEIQSGASLTADGRVLVNGSATQSLLVGGNLSFGGTTLFVGQSSGGNMTATLSTGGAITATSASANAGVLQFGQSNGSLAATGTFNLDGGTLTLAQIIEGGGTNNTSTFNFNGGTLKAKAGTSLNGTFLQGIDTANVRNGGAVIDTNGQALTIAQALNHSAIGGDNAIDGGLTKNGSSTLTLTGTSTYTGATKVNVGTLILSAAGTIDNSSGVTVASSATFSTAAKTSGYTVKGLAGAGTVTGLLNQAITLSSGGILAPGDAGVGTLTLSAGNLALANGTIYNYQIGGNTASPLSDLVQLTGPSSTVTLTGTQTLSLSSLGTVDPTGLTFVLFDSMSTLTLAGNWIIDYGTTGWTGGSVGIASGNIVLSGLTVAAIPEPSTFALLSGLGVVLLIRNQRKNRIRSLA